MPIMDGWLQCGVAAAHVWYSPPVTLYKWENPPQDVATLSTQALQPREGLTVPQVKGQSCRAVLAHRDVLVSWAQYGAIAEQFIAALLVILEISQFGWSVQLHWHVFGGK
jgi:hypothetical protein